MEPHINTDRSIIVAFKSLPDKVFLSSILTQAEGPVVQTMSE